MECPVCGLTSPPSSARCDCGYDFDRRERGRKPRRTIALTPSSVLPSLWFAWVVVTAGDFFTLGGSGYSDVWNYFPNALFNLFTPILMGNLARGWITVPILLAGLFLGDLIGKKIKLKILRIAYNLIFLLVITAIIDVITWGSPKSFEQIRVRMPE